MKLAISGWAENFESPVVANRPKKPMQFMMVRVHHEGIGSKMLDFHEEGDTYDAIFGKLCLLTAKLPLDLRGQLVRGTGEPYTLEDLYFLHGRKQTSFEAYKRAIAFFLQPRPGWLIDLDATAKAEPVRRVLEMPTPKIEEPSIYETAADRLLKLYTEADAPLNKIMGKDAVVQALLSRLEAQPNAKHPEILELIAENLAAMLWEAKDLKMVLRIDNFIRSGPCLAPRKSRKDRRGEQEAEAIAEMKKRDQFWESLPKSRQERWVKQAEQEWAGNPTVEPEMMAKTMAFYEAKEQGVYL
jgi:hypothetical protein